MAGSDGEREGPRPEWVTTALVWLFVGIVCVLMVLLTWFFIGKPFFDQLN